MATPIFPPELPIVSTFRLRPDSRLLTDEADQGPRNARRVSDVPAADADVEWIFIEQDLATFLEFRKTDLKNGHKRFCIELPSAGGITCHIVRLLSTRVRMTGHGSWTVSAALEIRERAFEIETCPEEPTPSVGYIGWGEPPGTYDPSLTSIENEGLISDQLWASINIFGGLVDNPGEGPEFLLDIVWEPVTPGDLAPVISYGDEEGMPYGYFYVMFTYATAEGGGFDHIPFGVLSITATVGGVPVIGRVELAVSLGSDTSYGNIEWTWHDTA